MRTWQWAPNGARIYFVTPDTLDEDDKARRDKKFTVNIRNPETPVSSLWALDVAARGTKRLTEGGAYSADDFTISKDSKWIGFRGLSPNRYKRGITQENLYSDLYLLDAATGSIERLTNNAEVGESGLSFSPDSTQIAFSAPDDLVNYGMSNNRVYLRAIAEKGKPFRKLGDTFDGDVSHQLLVQGRLDDLLQRGHQGHQPDRVARRALQHGAAAHRGKGQRLD